METELTKTIKRKIIKDFPNIMPSKLRTSRWATEVWTPTGICDVVKAEDYVEKIENECLYEENIMYMPVLAQDKPVCEYKNEYPNNEKCKDCFSNKPVKKIGVCLTCFEIKITVSDFKSKNGHNFAGNYNYYVVPKEIYEDILPLVEDGVGVITYNEDHGFSSGLRKMKKSDFVPVPEDIKSYIMYNMLKKWVSKDMSYLYYFAENPQEKENFISSYEGQIHRNKIDKTRDLINNIILECNETFPEILVGYELGKSIYEKTIKQKFKPKKINYIYLPYNTKQIEFSFVKGIIDNVIHNYLTWEDLMAHVQFKDGTYTHALSDLATSYSRTLWDMYITQKQKEANI